ncbi:FAD/NAD(P)-binding domain-containing protein [Phanerochaete sordida]|uniref:FAD/NAD(P)-binding domain-containing protein n=1 Tax=Phanerochaete sordida TaxID=48140 RepID=A0A9P3G0H0_9APHY|nr:FAD/NAD(P)-binding domain-containing protein [Phanerochaete sordida]
MDLLPNSAIDSERQADVDALKKRICVIGAGPTGLGSLKVICDAPQYKDGLWDVTAFEAREAIGGVWLPAPPVDNPPLTPMYDSLTTNIPHPIMAYPSYPFPPGTLLYPAALTVLQYFTDYATHFDLHKHVRVRTTVRNVDWDPSVSQWRVRTSPTGPSPDAPSEETLFDLVIVANGHYRVPLYPPTPGLKAWLEAGKAVHAAWYRHAEYHGDTVLVVGRGPSGIDVADEMCEVCKTLIHSFPEAPREDHNGGAVKFRGRIAEFLDPHEGRVRFEDGTEEAGVDYCILATGYEHSLPFLPPHLLERALPPPIPPIPEKLYNSKFHIFPLAKQIFPLVTSFPPSRLALLALPYRIIPFPFAEVQTRAVLKAFTDPDSLDPAREAVDIVSRYEELRAQFGDNEVAIARAWHKMEEEQFPYLDSLHQFVGGEYAGPQWKVPDWVLEIWYQKVTLRAEWKELVRIGEAEKWVEGVGKSGGEEGTKEWLELMRRVIKRAEQRKAEVSIDTAKMNRL